MVSGAVFTSCVSLSENVSTSFCCSWLPAPAAVAVLEQLLCRHLPNHQACVNMLGLGGEQRAWQKIAGLGKGQENFYLFPYLFVVLVQVLLTGFVPDAGRCCSVSWLGMPCVICTWVCSCWQTGHNPYSWCVAISQQTSAWYGICCRAGWPTAAASSSLVWYPIFLGLHMGWGGCLCQHSLLLLLTPLSPFLFKWV